MTINALSKLSAKINELAETIGGDDEVDVAAAGEPDTPMEEAALPAALADDANDADEFVSASEGEEAEE